MAAQKTLEKRVDDLKARLEETSLKLSDLTTMAELVTSLLDIDSILSVAMEMGIRMTDGEVGAILIDQDGELISKMNLGIDTNLIKSLRYKDDEDIATFVFNKQRPVIANDFEFDFAHGPKIESVLAIPIASRAHCHGAIIIVNKTSGLGFTDTDKENLKILAKYAAIAIDNSILLKESLEKQKMEQELSTATEIQNSILPSENIEIPGLEIGVLYIPARQVSGDFYDIIKLKDNECYLIIGDVSNKGVPAALVMSASTAIIRSQLEQNPELKPARLMSHLNKILCTRIIKSESMFVTLFIARLSLDKKMISYCNAGHPPPIIWQAKTDTMMHCKTGGPFVGQFEDVDYAQGEEALNSNDHIFAFTDGFSEATNANDELFGLERINQVFIATKDYSAMSSCEQGQNYIERFSQDGQNRNIDDLTIMKIIVK